MKRRLVYTVFTLFTVPAFACDTITSELWDDGVRTATYSGDTLTISHDGRGSEAYDVVSGGTGVPYGVEINVNDDTERQTVRMVGDKLLISMEVYEPYCR